jgi:opacity protein-like surface antigen
MKAMPMRNVLMVCLVAALGASWSSADASPSGGSPGFYGGIAARDGGAEQGVAIRDASGPWSRLAAQSEVHGSQALAYGGYRWRGDVALEAAIGSEIYRLPGRGGVGLLLPVEDDPSSRRWNVDVQGSFALWRSLSLYGRLGYSQSEIAPFYRTSVAASPGDWRTRDGLNYGVGLRYDVTRTLGVRLEYARTGLLGGESAGVLPYDDQLQLGVQFRF